MLTPSHLFSIYLFFTYFIGILIALIFWFNGNCLVVRSLLVSLSDKVMEP